MLILKAYRESTGSKDLTDILSGGEYWLENNTPAIQFLGRNKINKNILWFRTGNLP